MWKLKTVGQTSQDRDSTGSNSIHSVFRDTWVCVTSPDFYIKATREAPPPRDTQTETPSSSN